MNIRFVFFLCTLIIGNAFTQERALPVKVTQVRGTAFTFTNPEGPLYKVTPLMVLGQGHFIATGNNSTVLLDFTTNGVAVLGPRTILSIGARSKRGLRHVSLIQGSFYYQTRPDFRDRPPAVITSIRDNPEGFVGERYKIVFTEEEKSLQVLAGTVEKYPLKIKASQGGQTSESDDEWGDDEWDDGGSTPSEGQRLSSEELQKIYLTQLEEQMRGKKEEERFQVIIDQKSFEGKFIFRGIYNIEETSIQRSDEITVIQGDGETTTHSFDELRQFNRPRIAYDARLELKTDRKIGEARLYAAGWLEYGHPKDNYRSPLQIFNTRKEGRGPIEINELYLTNNWSSTDLTIGKRVFKTGTALLISPMDRITPKDLYDPLDYKDLGNWMIQVDHYLKGGSRFTYALLPYFLTNKSGVTFITELEEELIQPTQLYPKADQKSFTHYLQFKTILGGWDLIAGLKYGPNIYPIYTQVVDVDELLVKTFKEHPNVYNALFGYSTTSGPFNFYGEAVYQRSRSGDDDNFITGLLGTKYRNTEFASKFGLESIEFFAEFTKEKILQRQNSVATISPDDLTNNPDQYNNRKNNIQSSINWRSQRNNLISRLAFEVTRNLTLSATTNFNFEDGSLLKIGAIDYRLRDGFNLRLNYEAYTLDLSKSSRDSELLPFGFEYQTDSEQSANRTFQRYTLRIDYLF